MSEPKATEHTIQIELEGLISLLAQHLYADPDVFLREMIQNAHDSISRRAALAAERAEGDLPEGEVHASTLRVVRGTFVPRAGWKPALPARSRSFQIRKKWPYVNIASLLPPFFLLNRARATGCVLARSSK